MRGSNRAIAAAALATIVSACGDAPPAILVAVDTDLDASAFNWIHIGVFREPGRDVFSDHAYVSRAVSPLPWTFIIEAHGTESDVVEIYVAAVLGSNCANGGCLNVLATRTRARFGDRGDVLRFVPIVLAHCCGGVSCATADCVIPRLCCPDQLCSSGIEEDSGEWRDALNRLPSCW